MGEWIEHDGKGFPDVLTDAYVCVIFRDGLGVNWLPEPAEYWYPSNDDKDKHDYWVWENSDDDIVAYRIVNPTE